MLREEVLREFRSLKNTVLNDKKLIEKVNENLSYMIFEGSEFDDIRATPYQVIEKIKAKMPSIVQRYQDLRSKFLRSEFGEGGGESFFTYTTYIGLTRTYQKIMENFDTGPVIEEVE
jgi:hypothetical protein